MIEVWSHVVPLRDMSSDVNTESRTIPDNITDEMSEEEVAEWLKGKGIPETYCSIFKGIKRTILSKWK